MIEPSEIVVDLASHSPLQVVRVDEGPAIEHEKVSLDRTNALFGDLENDRVIHGIFLPTPDDDRLSAPSKPYAYPESRLVRYPVDRPDLVRNPQDSIREALLEELAIEADRLGIGEEFAEVLASVLDAETLHTVNELVDSRLAPEGSE